MISDVLHAAILDIDRYLTQDHSLYLDEHGNPDPEIVLMRNHMHAVLLDLDYPDWLLSDEQKQGKQAFLAKLKLPVLPAKNERV